MECVLRLRAAQSKSMLVKRSEKSGEVHRVRPKYEDGSSLLAHQRNLTRGNCSISGDAYVTVWDSGTAQRKFGLLPCLTLCLGGNRGSLPGLKDLALKRRSSRGNILFTCLVISFNCTYLFLIRQYILIIQNLKGSKGCTNETILSLPTNVTHFHVPLLKDILKKYMMGNILLIILYCFIQ